MVKSPPVVLCGLAADLNVELVSQSRLAVSAAAQFQRDTIQTHAGLGLAVAHVNLQQLEHLHCVLLQRLV